MMQFLSSNISNCRRYSHELHYASFCYIVALTFWIHLCKQKDQLLTQRLRFFFQNSNLQKWKKNEYQRMPMFKMRLNFQKWKGNEYQPMSRMNSAKPSHFYDGIVFIAFYAASEVVIVLRCLMESRMPSAIDYLWAFLIATNFLQQNKSVYNSSKITIFC